MTGFSLATSMADLHRLAGSGSLIAGGTDLLVQMRDGREEAHLIDISNIEDAPPAVDIDGGFVELSALAPISHVVAGLDGRLPGITAAARVFGSLQIRNRATIGGNLANASPAADLVPPLVAADADLVIDGPKGERTVPAGDFATGPGRTVLEADEWVRSVRMPLPEGEEGFRKLGNRSAMVISIVSLAWRWNRSADGTLRAVKLALGAVAPTVIRVPEAEDALEGRRPTEDVVTTAAESLRAAIDPIDDVRGSAWYRRQVAGDLLREALAGQQGAHRR
ncbi:MAG: FAD binding domain-containing protein [Acidimicrobiia bacterium]